MVVILLLDCLLRKSTIIVFVILNANLILLFSYLIPL